MKKKDINKNALIEKINEIIKSATDKVQDYAIKLDNKGWILKWEHIISLSSNKYVLVGQAFVFIIPYIIDIISIFGYFVHIKNAKFKLYIYYFSGLFYCLGYFVYSVKCPRLLIKLYNSHTGRSISDDNRHIIYNKNKSSPVSRLFVTFFYELSAILFFFTVVLKFGEMLQTWE